MQQARLVFDPYGQPKSRCPHDHLGRIQPCCTGFAYVLIVDQVRTSSDGEWWKLSSSIADAIQVVEDRDADLNAIIQHAQDLSAAFIHGRHKDYTVEMEEAYSAYNNLEDLFRDAKGAYDAHRTTLPKKLNHASHYELHRGAQLALDWAGTAIK